jgi:hypothetical protein
MPPRPVPITVLAVPWIHSHAVWLPHCSSQGRRAASGGRAKSG